MPEAGGEYDVAEEALSCHLFQRPSLYIHWTSPPDSNNAGPRCNPETRLMLLNHMLFSCTARYVKYCTNVLRNLESFIRVPIPKEILLRKRREAGRRDE